MGLPRDNPQLALLLGDSALKACKSHASVGRLHGGDAVVKNNSLILREQTLRTCRLVFGAGRKAGILPPEKDAVPRVDFVGFGLVLGSDGKRIRTRDEGAVRTVNLCLICVWSQGL